MQADKQYLQEVKTFRPFELTLKVQTQEEAQALYAMFNNERCNQVLGPCSRDIKNEIGVEFYIGEDDAIIGNGVTYKEYYRNGY